MPRTRVGQHFISDQKANIGFSLMYTQHKDLQNDYAIDLSILEQSGLPAGPYPIQPERVPGKWRGWEQAACLQRAPNADRHWLQNVFMGQCLSLQCFIQKC